MTRYVIAIITFFTGCAGLTQAGIAQSGGIFADSVPQPTLQAAFDAVNPGGIVRIEPGVYREGGTLKKEKERVLIIGAPGVVFDGVAVGGKAAFVIQADDVTIDNIECRNIKVGSRNGACVRHESGNLTLKNVRFIDNENGILTWGESNKILIEDSEFIGNGKAGRAHGIYVSGAKQLIVRRSQILGSRDQGHGIKSRAEYTLIENSVVASLEGDDSYLIDIPGGGTAVIRNSLLVEGANTVNWSIVSFGVETQTFERNSLKMEKNVIVTDREGGSEFINLHEDMPPPELNSNVIVGRINYDWPKNNFFFDSREDLKWPEAPALPEIDLSK